MHTLIVTAHPASYGLTHKIADIYKNIKEERGGTVTLIDLYSDEWKLDFLRFQNMREIAPSSVRDRSQAEITKADEIILVAPVWWVSVPAIMKNWFDHVFTSGFAFRYTKEGKPVPLLKGKTGRVFMTAGGPSRIYFFARPIMAIPITKGLFGFCGIKCKSFDVFANRNTPVIDPIEPVLETVRRRAQS